MLVYDYVIVGAGFFGSVFAREVTDAGKSCLVIDRRDHVGGNCYSYEHPGTNITVHKYGTHIFHTSDEDTWAYVNRFARFNRYQHRVLTTHRDRVYTMPISLGTINAFYGLTLKPSQVASFLESKKEAFARPKNLEEKAISLIGRDLYEAFIKGYTTKQWGVSPDELPPGIITRLPVRTSYYDSYFNDRYQGIPEKGYTSLFERLLTGVPVELNVDFFAEREKLESIARTVVYTGPIDRFFEFAFGRLNWRSVRFEVEHKEVADYQGTSVMNYADLDVPYTRIHEPKHLHLERPFAADTVIIREYPAILNDEPYYPVNLEADREVLRQYQDIAREQARYLFGGRLAKYKYYDMHQIVAAARKAARVELDR